MEAEEKLIDFADSPKAPSSVSGGSPTKSIGHSAWPRPYSPVGVAVVARGRGPALDEAEVVPLCSATAHSSSKKWTNV